VALTIVMPGHLAIRAAGWFRLPALAAVGPDRIGAAIAAGLHRHRAVVEVPGAALTVLRMMRLLAGRIREAARSTSMPRVTAVAEAASEPPLVGKSASGD
jgi:hypothetical protein